MHTRTQRLATLVSVAALGAGITVGLSEPAQATATRSFEIDDAAAFSLGELHHAAVESNGHVHASVGLSRIALPPELGVVYSQARAADGAIYLGTGEGGRIYRVRGEQVDVFAETSQMLVSSLVFGDGGVLYAGTVPEGRIFAIPTTGAQAGQLREFARPTPPVTASQTASQTGTQGSTTGTQTGTQTGSVVAAATAPAPDVAPAPSPAESIWDLAWDAAHQRLYAATGAQGHVFAIDPQGHTELLWDAPAAHAMSLAIGNEGVLYVGTSDDAVVARITSPFTNQHRTEIAWDFPGNEITDLAFQDGVLVVAANEFPAPPSASAGPTKRTASSTRGARPAVGHGRIWTLAADGRAERLWANEDGHVTRLSLGANGVIFGALGTDGRVVRIAPDRTSAVWLDVDEREVLALDMTGTAPFLATGDAAAFYRLQAERPEDPHWTSKVLDAELVSRFGQLTWRGTGTIRMETRSGNVERPDETWSDWSAPIISSGPIHSPAARFLQIRATFVTEGATLRALQAFYLPQNQRPVLSDVGLKARTTKRVEGEPPAPSPQLGLSWKVESVDGDRLRYRVRFREESQTVWRDLLRDSEVLAATEYQWNTSSVPDGFYVVQVEASDEPSNPDVYTLRAMANSEPLLVDNHPPELVDVRANGTHVTGRATDTMGPIARLEVAIDGGEWRMFFPSDDLFDTREERFDLDLTTLTTSRALTPGAHIIAIRTQDSAGNGVTAETTVDIPAAAAPAAPRPRRPAR
jgi:outer membrane protein assembly factor BamB